MKDKSTFLIAAIVLISVSVWAQPLVWQANIQQVNVNLRGVPVVLGIVVSSVSAPGKVLVRFDGTCLSDSGDLIVVAASDTPGWSVDAGNVGIEVVNAVQAQRSFSHTQVYSVTPGTDTFYAVAQNDLYENGSGIATIYGALTVEFFPAAGEATVADSESYWSGNLRGGPVVITSTLVDAPVPGTVVVRFDGTCQSSPLDDITLAANDTTVWWVDSNVNVVAASDTYNLSPFTHTRAYHIPSGDSGFYGVGQNWVITNGPGTAGIASTLAAEFFPDSGLSQVYSYGIGDLIARNVRDTPVVVASLTFNAPEAGQVLVQFDGNCSSSVGDWIALAASNTPNWSPGYGSTTVAASSPANYQSCFSNSRLYNIHEGINTVYAVVQNYGDTAGNGTAWIYGTLTAKYFGPAPAAAGINPITVPENSFQVYPNPASNCINVHFNGLQNNRTLQLTDISGQLINSIEVGSAQLLSLNISQLAAGVYLVKYNSEVRKIVKE